MLKKTALFAIKSLLERLVLLKRKQLSRLTINLLNIPKIITVQYGSNQDRPLLQFQWFADTVNPR